MSNADSKRASAQGSNYHNNIATLPSGEDEGNASYDGTDDGHVNGMLPAIEKVSLSTLFIQQSDDSWVWAASESC